MTTRPDNGTLEDLLAYVLRQGTRIATAAVLVGLLMKFMPILAAGRNDVPIVSIGLALFIFLPSIRLTLMFIVFLRGRDYHFSIISGLVLLIVTVGFVVALAHSQR